MEPSRGELCKKGELVDEGRLWLADDAEGEPVRFGLDHSAAYTLPSNGLLNLQGTRVP